MLALHGPLVGRKGFCPNRAETLDTLFCVHATVPAAKLFDSSEALMDTAYSAVHLDRVLSTQDLARQRLATTPVLVTATGQSQGRGRFGRSWDDAPAALAASLAWRPDWPQPDWPRLTLVAGLAARTAISGSGPAPVLKWPNDLLDGAGAKVGGLLAETDMEAVVVGMGLNLWWPDPPEGRAGIYDHHPPAGVGIALAEAWASDLLRRAGAGPPGWGRDEYKGVCVTLGAAVTWEPDGAGVAVDIDERGGLVVETAAGATTVLTAGEVRTVRTATLPRPESEDSQ